METVEKDPLEVIRFAVNFGPLLAGGNGIDPTTLASVTWPADDGITAEAVANTDTIAVVELSDGTLGERYRVRSRAVGADGQILYQSFYVLIKEQ
jgi:hypothetical protein